MPNWLLLILFGAIAYGLSYTPPVVQLGWAKFCQWVGGVLIFVGVVVLALLLLGLHLPG